MEKNALLAVVISLLILLVYYELVLPRYYPAPEETLPAELVEEPEAPLAERPTPAELAPPLAEVAPPEQEPETPVPAEGRDVVVETDLYEAVFTTAGARLRSLKLKKYRTAVDRESPPLDLIRQAPPGDLPLGVSVRGASKQFGDAAVAYAVDKERLDLVDGGEGSLTFTGQADGLTIVKRVELKDGQYFFDVGVSVSGNLGDYSELGIGWNKRLPSQQLPGHEIVFDSVVTLVGDKLHYEYFGKITEPKLLENDVGWVSYSGKYFLAAMVPSAEAPDGQAASPRVWIKQRGEAVDTQLLMPPGVFHAKLNLYLGPKLLDVLEGHSLRRAVDVGWSSFVALPLLEVLKFSHKITRNYGIDIILLTILIKILFIPLTHKSLQSMKQMQKLQPEMARIREAYKDKPEEMNKQVMELYRRHKVNPLGGCLPMLLQMPVFIGLYQGLQGAVELRHAPFMGWINDLSAPDRLGDMKIPFVDPAGFPVLTLLMGVSMFVQQWMTPATSADPTQQRIMLLMPVMFTFMFINFPSGLTLYWLVNNILTIAQQYAMNRPEAKAVAR